MPAIAVHAKNSRIIHLIVAFAEVFGDSSFTFREKQPMALELPDKDEGGVAMIDCAAVAEEAADRQLLDRFALERDGAAFEALVQRYGAMVLGVCQRLLDNAHDAEDAFQATFLVLVRKAGSIARPELLGNWLYGVACRVAKKARSVAVRRRIHERQAAVMPSSEPSPDVSRGELRGLLDQELGQLPEKYRAPLVLCYLQGLTNEQAARRLGWPAGSISYRLSRARELLRARLARRKEGLTSGAFATLLAGGAFQSAVPAPLADQTVQAGVALVHGQAVAISPAVQILVDSTVQAMRIDPTRWVAGLVLAVVLTVLAGAGLVRAGVLPDPTGVIGPSASDNSSAGGSSGCGCGR
jgi:RNA polymerase sigma factor (sigma-70 family)